MHELKTLTTMLMLVGATAAGCSTERNDSSAASPVAVNEAGTPNKPAPAPSTSPGKPTAPITIDYEVLGNPVVGQPVAVNVRVSSTRGPVTVQYSINDASAVMFQEEQVEQIEIADPTIATPQQLTVIPQREGRVYVNVSAEVHTDSGTMIRSMAIPIKVGDAPPTPTVNGELKEGPGGETVISMPAREN